MAKVFKENKRSLLIKVSLILIVFGINIPA